MNAVRLVIASNGIPYLQIRSVGLHSTSGKKERTGGKPRSNASCRWRVGAMGFWKQMDLDSVMNESHLLS